MHPFAVAPFLVVQYRPFAGVGYKNDMILDAAKAHPDRFLVSPRSGNPQALVARALTSPDNLAWEVWRDDTLCGILLLDRIVPCVDARLHFVFFDDELASKVDLLQGFMQRCFNEFGFERLTFEAPAYAADGVVRFVRRKLGFHFEGALRETSLRERAYFDGLVWHDVIVLRALREELLI